MALHQLIVNSLLISVLATPFIVNAQSNEEASSVVEISSTKDPELKSYKQIYKGLETFEKNRQLAPKANLKFKLLPLSADTSLDGVSLRIAGDEVSENIPVAADGSFVLPNNQKAVEENADLLLNKKKGLFRWRPYILSEGILPGHRRLGDLRLECEIRWAVEYEELPFITRNAFRLAGGPCHSSHITVTFWSGKKLKAAYLLSGERRQNLSLGPNGERYTLPLHDSNWDDESLVEFEFAEASK